MAFAFDSVFGGILGFGLCLGVQELMGVDESEDEMRMR